MGTVTGITPERAQEIEDNSIVDVAIVSGILSFTKGDGTETDVGRVIVGTSPAPVVSGSRGGNAALASLLTALAAQNIITNSTTA